MTRDPGTGPAWAAALVVLLAAASAAAPAAPQESEKKTRDEIQTRYSAAAKSLMTQDPKSFALLKTSDFVCKPIGAGASAKPSLAPVTSAGFSVGGITLTRDQAVVENVETVMQDIPGPAGGAASRRSKIRRRDIWIKQDGAWKLRETQRLGVESERVGGELAAPAEPAKPARKGPLETSEFDDKIAGSCGNEIGILCYPVRQDMRKAKACLMRNQDYWLAGCKKTWENLQTPRDEEPAQ